MQRAMAAEAEATREARAKVIAAEGEMKASRALKEASDVINQSPAALQASAYNYTLQFLYAKNNYCFVFFSFVIFKHSTIFQQKKILPLFFHCPWI